MGKDMKDLAKHLAPPPPPKAQAAKGAGDVMAMFQRHAKKQAARPQGDSDGVQ